jgi:hypothetical protein
MEARVALVAMLVACSNGASHPAPPGSGSGSAPAPPPIDPPIVTDKTAALKYTGKLVEVRGKAEDAKLAAGISIDKLFVYCLGTDRWPANLANKPIAARGTLEQTDEFSPPENEDPNLPKAAGTSGLVWVLRKCEYPK